MFDFFKKYDIIEEMDSHIKETEDIFVECKPNKLPFILQHMKQSIVSSIALIVLIIIYLFIRPFLGVLIFNLIDIGFILIGAIVVGFTIWQFLRAFRNVNNSFYVIATDGIHMIGFDNVLDYSNITFGEIRGAVLEKKPISKMGNIIIKEKNDKNPDSFFKRFLSHKKGFIAIDDVEDVYEVLKQLTLQENEDAFFADAKSAVMEHGKNKNVKKYDNKIDKTSSKSLIEKRNK